MAQLDTDTKCVVCKKPALENCYSEMGIKEVYKTGICEKCFDELFKEDDIEDSPFIEQ